MNSLNLCLYVYDTMIKDKFPTLIGYYNFPNGISDNFKLDKSVKFVDVIELYDRDICFRAYVGETINMSDINDGVNIIDNNGSRINSVMYGKDVRFVIRREGNNIHILNFLKPGDYSFRSVIDLENFLISLANETREINSIYNFKKVLKIKKA